MSGQNVAITALLEGTRAAREVLSAPSPWDPNFAGKLESHIDVEAARAILKLLDAAQDLTPEFLRGVLVGPGIMAEIRGLLLGIDGALRYAAKVDHCHTQNGKAVEANMAGILRGIIKSIPVE